MFGLLKRKSKGLKITAACGCNIGCVRNNNEDNFCFNGIVLPIENRGLEDTLFFYTVAERPVHFGVFDGMGGEAYGESAAYIAAEEIRELSQLATIKEVLGALHRANEKICADAHQRECGIIGTTAAILTFDSGYAYTVNIGDSRVYRFRDGSMEQLSTDHTERAMLEQHGVKGRKPRLTQHLGIDPTEMVIEPTVRKDSALVGDRYVICSDGLSDMVPEDEIAAVLASGDAPNKCVNALIDMALQNGGKDNVTVITIAID